MFTKPCLIASEHSLFRLFNWGWECVFQMWRLQVNLRNRSSGAGSVHFTWTWTCRCGQGSMVSALPLAWGQNSKPHAHAGSESQCFAAIPQTVSALSSFFTDSLFSPAHMTCTILKPLGIFHTEM